jgi:hypothetical protein
MVDLRWKKMVDFRCEMVDLRWWTKEEMVDLRWRKMVDLRWKKMVDFRCEMVDLR